VGFAAKLVIEVRIKAPRVTTRVDRFMLLDFWGGDSGF